jgi:hypothetical protein
MLSVRKDCLRTRSSPTRRDRSHLGADLRRSTSIFQTWPVTAAQLTQGRGRRQWPGIRKLADASNHFPVDSIKT